MDLTKILLSVFLGLKRFAVVAGSIGIGGGLTVTASPEAMAQFPGLASVLPDVALIAGGILGIVKTVKELLKTFNPPKPTV